MLPQSQSTTMGVNFNRQALMVVLVMVFLSIAGYGIMIPVAPFLIARYVSDPTRIGITVGLLTTLYAVCQFLAAPGLGAISDRFGRRPILLLCLLGSAGGFLLLGIQGADEHTQGKVQGGNKSIQSLAAIIGPVIAGGLYDHLGYSSPYVAGAGLFVLTIGAILLALPVLQRVTEASAQES